MGDDDRPEGYRIPGRVHADPELETIEDDGALDAPVVRLANALLLGALRPEGTLLRVGPSPSALVEQRRAGGRWEKVLESTPAVGAAVARRFKLMASLPPHAAREAGFGFIRLSMSLEREEDFCTFVRPCTVGERVILRHVPQEQRYLFTSSRRVPEESLDPLRWQAEHAFRLARSAPTKSFGPMRELIAATEALGADGAALRMRAAWALGEAATGVGELDEALEAFTVGCQAARTHFGGEGPAYAELAERRADVLRRLGRHDPAVAILVDALAIARRVAVDDPLVAALLHALALVERDAGREEEARARYDEAIAYLTALSGADDQGVAELVAARDGG